MNVAVSVGSGVAVSVSVGIGVKVSGMDVAVNVSAGEKLVGDEPASGEGDAGVVPVGEQAKMMSVSAMRMNFFMSPLYPKRLIVL